MATVNCLVTNILQSIFFCIQQLNEIQTGLEQIEVKKWQNYICGVNYPFIIADLKVYSKSLFWILFENKLEMSDDVTNEIFQYTVLFAQMLSRLVQSPQYNSRLQFVLLNIAEQEHRLQMTKVILEKPLSNIQREGLKWGCHQAVHHRTLILCEHHSNQVCFKTLLFNQLLGLKTDKHSTFARRIQSWSVKFICQGTFTALYRAIAQ